MAYCSDEAPFVTVEQEYTYIEIFDAYKDWVIELCKDYWDYKVNPNKTISYIFNVDDLAEKYNTNKQYVSETIMEASNLFIKGHVCSSCDIPLIICNNRSEFNKYKMNLRSMVDRKEECSGCQEERKYNEEIERKRKNENKFLKNLEEHKAAIELGVYETLNNIEWNYLLSLAKENNNLEAGKKIGISKDRSIKIFRRLADLNLVALDPRTNGFAIDEDFKHSLQKIGTISKVKPVFGSKLAKEAYTKLKKDHLFVYPEIAIASFIKKSTIEHLLKESWHTNYFLTSRVDFVITDQEGIPKFAVEFQGSYHKDGEQKEKDKFKESVLEEVGVPLQYLTAQDLQ